MAGQKRQSQQAMPSSSMSLVSENNQSNYGEQKVHGDKQFYSNRQNQNFDNTEQRQYIGLAKQFDNMNAQQPAKKQKPKNAKASEDEPSKPKMVQEKVGLTAGRNKDSQFTNEA